MYGFYIGFAKRLKDYNDRFETQHQQQLNELEERITTKHSLEIIKLKKEFQIQMNKLSSS